MTENVFGIWKMRFPILNHIGCHIPLAQDIITATAILHNILVRWNANLPDLDLPDDLADGWRIRAATARARNAAACAAMRVPLDEAEEQQRNAEVEMLTWCKLEMTSITI